MGASGAGGNSQSGDAEPTTARDATLPNTANDGSVNGATDARIRCRS